MKTKSETIKLKCSLLLIALVLYSCSKDIADDQVGEIIDDASVPEIQTIDPAQGRAATEVTIDGINFGTDINNIQLFFNNTEAEITALTDTSITTTVPRSIETGNIRILVDGQEITGPEFTYVITPAQVTTIAGQGASVGDVLGPIDEASFNIPIGIIKDSQGILYVSDFLNRKIKKIDTNTRTVSILAGDTIGNSNGTGTAALFRSPRFIIFDNDQNIIISDQGNHQIRKVTPNGVVTTIAGTGTAGFENGMSSLASFWTPTGIAIDESNNIYVSDFNNNSIRKIRPDGEVITVAGNGIAGDTNGIGVLAQFNGPIGMDIDQDDNLYVTDFRNHKIKKISTGGTVTVVAGSGIPGDTDGTANEAQFRSPEGIIVADNGDIYIADSGNHKIKKISIDDGTVTTIAGTGIAGDLDGDALNATFRVPRGLFLDESTGELYITMNHSIRKITPAF